MPHHEAGKYLYDIISSCEFILEFTEGKIVDDYKDNRAFRSALERELQIIGEAMMRLDREYPDLTEQITQHRSIIGFRHVLVHGYDSLDPDTVWNVVETKLKPLLNQAKELLG